MELLYSLKEQTKIIRWKYRRWQTANQYGRKMLENTPIVIGNAIPKAGSHLIHQVLLGLTKIGPFVDPGFPPLNRWEDNRKLDQAHVMKNIRRLSSGDLAYGYIASKEPYLTELTRKGIALIFIYRDPRDVVVSAVKYGMVVNPDHTMHDYYINHLKTDEERYNAVIKGVTEPGYEMDGVRGRFQKYSGWLHNPAVLTVKFEDLIQEREASLEKILEYLEEHNFQSGLNRKDAITAIMESMDPKRSGTFRKGLPGAWRKSFSQPNIDVFKECAGDILAQYGYEMDNNW